MRKALFIVSIQFECMMSWRVNVYCPSLFAVIGCLCFGIYAAFMVSLAAVYASLYILLLLFILWQTSGFYFVFSVSTFIFPSFISALTILPPVA